MSPERLVNPLVERFVEKVDRLYRYVEESYKGRVYRNEARAIHDELCRSLSNQDLGNWARARYSQFQENLNTAGTDEERERLRNDPGNRAAAWLVEGPKLTFPTVARESSKDTERKKPPVRTKEKISSRQKPSTGQTGRRKREPAPEPAVEENTEKSGRREKLRKAPARQIKPPRGPKTIELFLESVRGQLVENPDRIFDVRRTGAECGLRSGRAQEIYNDMQQEHHILPPRRSYYATLERIVRKLYDEGLTAGETAEKMGVSIRAVRETKRKLMVNGEIQPKNMSAVIVDLRKEGDMPREIKEKTGRSKGSVDHHLKRGYKKDPGLRVKRQRRSKKERSALAELVEPLRNDRRRLTNQQIADFLSERLGTEIPCHYIVAAVQDLAKQGRVEKRRN